MAGGREIHVHRVGRRPYGPMLQAQVALRDARIAGDVPDTLLLLEHDPVITLGRSSSEAHILATPEALRSRGIECYEIGRGGDVTYHGPGQLVGYPIVDLRPDRKDVRRFVTNLEEVMIRVCAHYGLRAGRVEGLNGTWIEDRKVGAVGVRIRQWVTMHGFALNVNTELSAFDVIVPCGIQDKAVTSLQGELGRELPMQEVQEVTAAAFADVFESAPVLHDGMPQRAGTDA